MTYAKSKSECAAHSQKCFLKLTCCKKSAFFHYLNHRYLDIPNSGYTSSKKVIEGIIQKFAKNIDLRNILEILRVQKKNFL